MTRNDGTPCARCGKPAEGYAFIDEARYCHGDHPPGEPSCYMLASWEVSHIGRGISDAADGRTVSRGSFAEHAPDEEVTE